MNLMRYFKAAEKFTVDNSPLILTGFGAAGVITTAVRTGKATIKAYDVVFENFAGLGASVAQRAVFIIDKEGIIRYVEVTPSLGELPDLNSLKEALNSINQAFI